MLRYAGLALLLAGCVAGSPAQGRADEPVFSGPQVGEAVEPFKIRQALGDAAGEEIDVVANAKGKPLLLVFVNGITRPSVGLTRILADYAATRAGDGLHSAVVLLTVDATATETWMKNARHALPQKTVVGISLDGAEGPGAYGLNREVSLTVLVAKENKVTANFALVQPSMQADGPKILKAIVDVLGGGDVPKIEDLAGGAAMRREGRPAAGAGDELRAMLRPVIQLGATDEQIDKAAKAVDDAAAKNRDFANQIGQIASRIIAAGKLSDYGTPRSQEHLQRWARRFAPPKGIASHNMHTWLFIVGVLSIGPVDFDADVLPIFTHSGCNAAACHGAAAGRGGFALSLYGARPADDYNAIVRQLKGRRINFREPQKSLLLASPTGELEHGGDVRLDADGPHTALIARWIAEGARRSESLQLAGLEVTASQAGSRHFPAEARLTPTAIFADGQRRDVRALAVYASADESAAEISQSGVVKLLRPGRQIITVRYATQVTSITLTTPLNAEPVDFAAAPSANFIDGEIYATLGELRLPVSPPADDATFLRRARLDFTGRLPTPNEIEAFLADETADKRTKRIDELLASDDFNDYWTHRLATWLRIGATGSDGRAARTYYDWLHDAVANGRPLDELVRDLVTGDGDTHAVGPANFYRAAGDARGQAEYFSEVLLGVRLRCANCHNHPLDRWTQDDYHGLAAMFAQLDRSQMIRFIGRGEVSHPATGEAAVPRIPGQKNLPVDGDHRAMLAEWLVDSQNPYFARATVNRFWSALLGRGLVEPVDDFRATNPPTHPALLEKLAADFVEHRFDLRHTLRTIALSSAYARASQPLVANRSDDRYYSHALAKPLSPEVRLDAIGDVIGDERAARAINFIGAGEPAPLGLDELGRCSRAASCEIGGATTSGLAQQLALLNGRLLNEPLAHDNGRIAQLAEVPDEKLISRGYLLALSRPPTENEQAFWCRELRDAAADERRAVVEDFVWSLLNCDEFVRNH